MKISYAITVCNEHKEIEKLLTFLFEHKRQEDQVVVQMDKDNVTDEVWDVCERFENRPFDEYRLIQCGLNKNFAQYKNNLNKQCDGNWIFQIDADEIPNEVLLQQLPQILEINDTDLVWVPRINLVNGITDFHLNLWKWRITEQGWINYPDYQARIFKNADHIKWVKPVHEVIDGATTYSHLPPHEELTLKHEKDINRQEMQNKLYDDIL